MMVDTRINQAQYKKLAGIVYRASGIVLGESKVELLKARLAKRMRRINIKSPEAYIQLIENDPDEFLRFIDVITTNHTFFFRENKHCEFLVSSLDRKIPIKIWSAASSSGEEPYSIAVQLLANSFEFSMSASDLSDSMLEVAKRGIYSKDRVSTVPLPMVRAYFQKGQGKWEDYVRVKPQVRQYIHFFKYNLISDNPSDAYDIIFCRNVMIYFDNPTKQKVVDSLTKALKPGGYFFVGMSESLQGLNHQLLQIMPSGYRKK